jgi:hypothetical protein
MLDGLKIQLVWLPEKMVDPGRKLRKVPYSGKWTVSCGVCLFYQHNHQGNLPMTDDAINSPA